MQEKAIQLREGVWIHIPDGLSSEQEAQLVANLDSAALEAECRKILQMHEEDA